MYVPAALNADTGEDPTPGCRPATTPRAWPRVDVDRDRRLMPGIHGLRLTITGVNAKFKYRGNKAQEHRAEIATALQMRDGPMDAAARRRVLSRKKPC